jgi:hypothetical protein
MRLLGGVLAACTGLATPAAGADWEVAVHGGPTFPFYSQSFAFDPGPLGLPGGAVIEQDGLYRLDGKGGLSLGGALSFHPHPVIGLELRLDTADVNVRTGGVSYRVRVALPPPLGTLDSTVALTEGEGDLERLRPVSLNLRLRSRGTTRWTASGGISYLPSFRFAIRQPIEASVGDGPQFEVGRIGIPAEALPDQEGDGRWGVNGGIGIGQRVSARLRLQADGRYFRFQRQTLYWGEPTATGTLTPLQDQLVREITGRLDPVRFNPTFFQATVGVALSF